jgi:hypothetical protein
LDFGKWNSVLERFRPRVKADTFYCMFMALAEDADFECAVTDGSVVKVNRHGQVTKGDQKPGLVSLAFLERGRTVAWRQSMTKRAPFKYLKTSPEIIRLAVMLYI